MLVVTVVSILAVLTSCNNEKVKLLDTHLTRDGSYIKHEYDNENRITNVVHFLYYYMDGQSEPIGSVTMMDTFIYSGNDLVKVVSKGLNNPGFGTSYEVTKNGNKISIHIKSEHKVMNETVSIDLNGDGYPIRSVAINNETTTIGVYDIQDGNLMKKSFEIIRDGHTSERSTSYKYDDRKSPLFHSKTPAWWWIFSEGRSVRNNDIEEYSSNGSKSEYKYEYDKDGYPVRKISRSSGKNICEYTYFMSGGRRN